MKDKYLSRNDISLIHFAHKLMVDPLTIREHLLYIDTFDDRSENIDKLSITECMLTHQSRGHLSNTFYIPGNAEIGESKYNIFREMETYDLLAKKMKEIEDFKSRMETPSAWDSLLEGKDLWKEDNIKTTVACFSNIFAYQLLNLPTNSSATVPFYKAMRDKIGSLVAKTFSGRELNLKTKIENNILYIKLLFH